MWTGLVQLPLTTLVYQVIGTFAKATRRDRRSSDRILVRGRVGGAEYNIILCSSPVKREFKTTDSSNFTIKAISRKSHCQF